MTAGQPSEQAVHAAAEALEDAAMRLKGHDLGTVHRDEIARLTVAAAYAIDHPAADEERSERDEIGRALLRQATLRFLSHGPYDPTGAAYWSAGCAVIQKTLPMLASDPPAPRSE